jgi:hypothetical protein
VIDGDLDELLDAVALNLAEGVRGAAEGDP